MLKMFPALQAFIFIYSIGMIFPPDKKLIIKCGFVVKVDSEK